MQSADHPNEHRPARKRRGGGISQETEDAIVTLLLQRLAANGYYKDVMAELSANERAEVEAAVERHAARRRARGEAGW